MYIAEINIMPRPELLDPQGKAVEHGLSKLGLDTLSHVRIGKHITLKVDAESMEAATEKVETACKKLLHNPVMEFYEFVIKEAE
jgi:phosphoribosylformylglycinamidine synthase subunit PurS